MTPADDSGEIDDTGFEIPRREGIEVFVNGDRNITFKQVSTMGEEALIWLHADEVRELMNYLPKFMEKNFPIDGQ